MTGLVLLCQLMSTQHLIPRFWLGIQWVYLKMLKWDHYSFHNKTLSISQCSCCIFWLLRDAYSLLGDPNALCWKVCCSWLLHEIMRASRFSLLAIGCGLLFVGFWRRVLLEYSKVGKTISNFIRRLYQGCECQLGTTMIPVATSKTFLC